MRILRHVGIAALAIGAGAAAAGCQSTTPTTPSPSASATSSAPAQTATAWWNSAGQGFFEASNRDLTAVNNDGIYNPSAVPADYQQLISDAQAALANPPPVDPADYNAYYNDVLQLAENPGPMTPENLSINNDGAQHLQSFQDTLACYVPSAGGTCAASGSSGGGSAPVPSQSSPGSGSGSGGTSSSSGAAAQITANWESFFSSSTPASQKAALLQNGSAFSSAISEFASSPLAQSVSATVTSVTMASATQATVTYNLLVGGQAVETNAAGTAVDEGGTWKVGDASFCSLLSEAGSQLNIKLPAACQSAS